MSEKNSDGGLSISQRNAEAIIERLGEYLSLRFDMASRVNGRLKSLKQDLLYHELASVRRCMLSSKIYGPIRVCVADVFVGDDETRRRNLMSTTDQTSIQVELVSHCNEERGENSRGQVKIQDLKAYYSSIDPSLAPFIDLFEAWIWWDVFDAVERVRFERKVGAIQAARMGRVPDAQRKRYALMISPLSGAEAIGNQTSGTAGDEEIIAYELEQLRKIHTNWAMRRANERGFMFVLKRDEMPCGDQGEMIHRVADKVREYDRIESLIELEEPTRQHYAPELHVTPAKVEREMVMNLLKLQLIEIEREMVGMNDEESRLGPPYNFKQRQLDQMTRWLNELTPPSARPRETVVPAGVA